MDNSTVLNQTADTADVPVSNGADTVKAIIDGGFVLQVFIENGGEILTSAEYDDASISIENHAETIVAAVGGSEETTNGIWQALEMFGAKLSEIIEAGLDDDSTVPVLAVRLYPEQPIAGISYAEMAFPQLWAFSAESFGKPADHIRVAFPSRLCGVYSEEEIADANSTEDTAETEEFYDDDEAVETEEEQPVEEVQDDVFAPFVLED